MTEEEIKINHPKLICIAIGLAMGIAVLVLSVMQKIDSASAVTMLALGVSLYGVALLMPSK